METEGGMKIIKVIIIPLFIKHLSKPSYKVLYIQHYNQKANKYIDRHNIIKVPKSTI